MKHCLLVELLAFTLAGSLVTSRQDRFIPVEYSCNRLPYILKDTELKFSYSAEHLTDLDCTVTVTGKEYEQICVEFIKFYLDCDTDIILVDGAVSSLSKKIYKCGSDHSSDFCSSGTTIEVIFNRKSGNENDKYGHVEFNVYGTGKTDFEAASTATAFVVVGSIFGVILLLMVSAFVLSRVLVRLHYKPSCKHRQDRDQNHPHEELPLEPPPPYEEVTERGTP